MIWLLLGSALASEVWHATPSRHRDPTLVVMSPGFAVSAYLPLVQGLVDARRDVHVLRFDCDDGGIDALTERVQDAARGLGPDTAVVAHGLGAVPALRAVQTVEVERVVLLAPLLDLWPLEAAVWAAQQPVLDWQAPIPWRDWDLRVVLLGTVPELTCVPPEVAGQVRGWVEDAAVPLPLEGIRAPVALAVSAGDSVAAVEAVVAASRRLPHRSLTRLGIENLNGRDFDHTAMLMAPLPVRWAVKAVTARRPFGSP